jgi:hypothetical protein
LFETFLTEKIGPLYNHPIEFKVLPVDYAPENDMEDMIGANKIDFLCESSFAVGMLNRLLLHSKKSAKRLSAVLR